MLENNLDAWSRQQMHGHVRRQRQEISGTTFRAMNLLHKKRFLSRTFDAHKLKVELLNASFSLAGARAMAAALSPSFDHF